MTELEKQLLDVARSILADDMLPLLPAEYVAKVRSAIAAAEAAATSAQPAPNYPAVPEGWALVKSPITEDMHRAAVKVLVRANGVDGLPQRMLDAMVATAPPATVKDSLIVQQAPAGRLSYFAYDPDTGFEQFNTEAEAMSFAQESIDAYRDAAGDGWDEGVENVCWGVVHGTTQQVAVEDDYDGRDGLGDMLFVDYILTGPAPASAQVEQQAPAIDATQIVEQIAQQWDECEYDGIDIGAAIRAAATRLAAEAKGGE
ncbi:hypothetical protein HA052_11180 [Chromobacterium haemolyticum]|uniref:Uncharacterized protein n=1 Tax=Chromobacterium fluminis TaxID=3044269 RepID=A0ABX0LEL3_9NEIS|nr:hypothetical protein [Chromobacterium haemolyticum]NHR05762.1 hypothetical protein [Chromobacterium haemolyticum]